MPNSGNLRRISQLFVAFSLATTGVPNYLDFSGYLTDSTGAPIDSVVDARFILTVGSSQTIVWCAEYTAVVVNQGSMYVTLGSNEQGGTALNTACAPGGTSLGIAPSVFANVASSSVVAVTVAIKNSRGVFETLSPSFRVSSSVFALRTETLSGHPISEFAVSDPFGNILAQNSTSASPIPVIDANGKWIGSGDFSSTSSPFSIGSATVSGTASVTGLLNANGGIATSNQSINAGTGTVTAGGATFSGNLAANGGITTDNHSINSGTAGISGGTGSFSSTLSANGGLSATTGSLSGALAANGGLTSTTGAFSGTLAANGGLTSTTGTFSGALAANGGLTSTTGAFSGALAANGGLSATTGAFSGVLAANGGMTANTGTFSGALAANNGLTGTTGSFTGALGSGSLVIGTNQLVVSSGNVGIGTASPGATLQVAGPIVSTPVTIASGGVVDLSTSNTFILDAVGGSTITLSNMTSTGGRYKLIVKDTTERTYSFANCANSNFVPRNRATASGARSIYDIVTVFNGTNYDCYISWSTGYGATTACPISPTTFTSSSLYTVPSACTGITVKAWGGGGGGGTNDVSIGAPGGGGAYAENTSIPVIPGEVLRVYVGGGGQPSGAGGLTGGGAGGSGWSSGQGGGGGGFTAIMRGASPLVLAGGGGGGGGGGWYSVGGAGGAGGQNGTAGAAGGGGGGTVSSIYFSAAGLNATGGPGGINPTNVDGGGGGGGGGGAWAGSGGGAAVGDLGGGGGGGGGSIGTTIYAGSGTAPGLGSIVSGGYGVGGAVASAGVQGKLEISAAP